MASRAKIEHRYRHMSHARIQGTVVRVNRRGKHLFTFEGTNLTKLGHSEHVSVEFAENRYTGELVAIGPNRAIVQISPVARGHGIVNLRESAALTA